MSTRGAVDMGKYPYPENNPLHAGVFNTPAGVRGPCSLDNEYGLNLPQGAIFIETEERYIVRNPAEDGLDTNEQ